MRRLTVGLRGLLASLPDGPLKQSYPDWIAETWERDLGPDAALALMRAQNEPPETVVRLVRGEIAGEPTDIPGAYRVERVDEQALAEGRVWPQSRGSQLAGLAVGSQPGERTLDVCAAPGGKATMLAGEVVAVEKHEGRARELVGERGAPWRDERPRRQRRRARAAGRSARLRSCARRRALLRARSPRTVAPTSAGAASRSRSSSSSSCARPPSASGRAARHLLGVHAQHGRERGGRRRVRASSSTTSAPSGLTSAIRRGPSSCSRCRTSTGHRGSSSPAYDCPRDRLPGAGARDSRRRRSAAHIRSRTSAPSSFATARSSARDRPRRPVATARSSRSTQPATRARGATLYVTMEPCAHHGSTPPCADAVVAAGVAKVVVGSRDPNPEAAGGVERLRDAGVEVELVDSFAARAQTEAWRTWITPRPSVRDLEAGRDARRPRRRARRRAG